MGRTLNVSEGGILLETNVAFEIGQSVSISIGLEEEEVDVEGRVVHCKPSGGDHLYAAGIQFEEMDERGREVLEKYLGLFRAASAD